ncbi:MAG: RDD family protein [Candidatus Acinetobacter avistercoris]|uniref:RDD family protein n=1 Tax=Acinetobacter sp. KS-LM10 TaxID=3120518 RepID=UPI001F84EEA3|nr:RDD family protein [Candidatus Acinetobacter avistercoris]
MQIYLARNNQQAGPYTLEQINQMLASQQVLLTDLAWHQGMTEWKVLGELTQGQLEYQPQGYTSPAPFNPIPDSNTQPQDSLHQVKIEKKIPEVELAPFYSRFIAKFIDIFLWLPATYILTAFFTPEEDQKFLALNTKLLEMFMSKSTDVELMQSTQTAIFSMIPSTAITSAAIYILIMLCIQGFLLHKHGQSIGKKLLGIQVVDYNSGTTPGVVRAFILRSLVFILPTLYLMPLFSIIDYLFSIGKKKQTLHDKLAKTKVIKRAK